MFFTAIIDTSDIGRFRHIHLVAPVVQLLNPRRYLRPPQRTMPTTAVSPKRRNRTQSPFNGRNRPFRILDKDTEPNFPHVREIRRHRNITRTWGEG